VSRPRARGKADTTSGHAPDTSSENPRVPASEALEEAISAHGDVVHVAVHAAPRASRTEVVGLHAGRLKVAVAAPPVDGEANAALIAFLARALGVRRADVTLVHGASGRSKTFAIRGLSREAVAAALAGGSAQAG
jgi:uncharacterized protein (TIGR00251 family)